MMPGSSNGGSSGRCKYDAFVSIRQMATVGTDESEPKRIVHSGSRNASWRASSSGAVGIEGDDDQGFAGGKF